jgi:hypothetical protein
VDSYLRRIFLACLDVDQQHAENLELLRERYPDRPGLFPKEIRGTGRNFYRWDRATWPSP